MINKKAINNIKQKGFQSKSQLRYLLMLAQQHPALYSWVWDALSQHGVPSTEKVEPSYWSAPYKVSPDTPSYVYVRKSSIIRLIKIAQEFDNLGNKQTADRLDKIVIKKVMTDTDKAKDVVNKFWSIRGNECPKKQEDLQEFFDKLEIFIAFRELNPETKQEARRMLGDKIKGRDL